MTVSYLRASSMTFFYDDFAMLWNLYGLLHQPEREYRTSINVV